MKNMSKILIVLLIFVFASAGLTAELTPEQRAKIQVLDTSKIQTPSERINTNLDGVFSENYGNYYYTEGKADQALNEYLDAVKKYTGTDKEPSIHFKIGLCYEALHKDKEAMDKYREILTKYPNSREIPEARYHLAGCYNNNALTSKTPAQKDKAIEEYNKIISEYFPGKTNSYLLASTFSSLGGCYKAGHQLTDKSREYFQKAIDCIKNATDVSEKIRLSFIGEQYIELEQYDQAIAACQAEVEKFGPDALTIFHLGYIFLEQGNLKKAIEKFNQALSLKPSDNVKGMIYCHTGICYFKMEKFSEAAESFQMAADSKPMNWIMPTIYYWLGRSFMSSGKGPEAKEVFNTLINNYPESEYVPEAKIYAKSIK